jgi:hypothetical protein
MRFEGAHQPNKRVTHVTQNRMNLISTLSIKNQLKLANLIVNFDCALNDYIFENAFTEIDGRYLNATYNLNIPYSHVNVTKTLKYKGIYQIQENTVLQVSQNEHNEPIFGIVKCIFCHNNITYICFENLEFIIFDYHYFAYRVNYTKTHSYSNILNLPIHNTYHISNTACNGPMIMWD